MSFSMSASGHVVAADEAEAAAKEQAIIDGFRQVIADNAVHFTYATASAQYSGSVDLMPPGEAPAPVAGGTPDLPDGVSPAGGDNPGTPTPDAPPPA